MHYFKLLSFAVFITLQTGLVAQVSRPVDTLYQSGLAAWDRMEYALALEKLDEFLYHKPSFIEAYFYRGAVKAALKKFESALTDYNILLELDPQHSAGLHARAILNYELKKYDAAREDFYSLRSIPRGETNALLFKRSKYGGGVDGISTVQSDNHAEIYQYLGMIEKEQKNYDRALLYFDSALYLRPQEPGYYINRGLLHQAQSNFSLAEKDYLKALDLYPGHALAEYNLAVLMQSKGEEAGASDYFTRAIQDNPNSPYPYRQRAYRSIQQRHFTAALKDLDHALSLDDSDAETWLNHGLSLSKLKRWKEAIRSYTRAIELKPDLEKAYLNRGNTLYRLELYQEALNDYQAALLFRPGYGIALYHRALVYHQLGDDPKACDDLEKAIKKEVKPAKKAKAKICNDGM